MTGNAWAKQFGPILLADIETSVDEADPVIREAAIAVECGERVDGLRELMRLVAARRSQSVRLMDAAGMSRAQVAAAIGLSRQRVQQILDR